MNREKRREAVRSYKDRRIPQGIFAVRCAATGETWVGASRNLDQQRNGVWFTLRHGGHPNRALQSTWASRGADAFAFEVVEVLKVDDLNAYAMANLLKDRERHWLAALQARRIAG